MSRYKRPSGTSVCRPGGDLEDDAPRILSRKEDEEEEATAEAELAFGLLLQMSGEGERRQERLYWPQKKFPFWVMFWFLFSCSYASQ